MFVPGGRTLVNNGDRVGGLIANEHWIRTINHFQQDGRDTGDSRARDRADSLSARGAGAGGVLDLADGRSRHGQTDLLAGTGLQVAGIPTDLAASIGAAVGGADELGSGRENVADDGVAGDCVTLVGHSDLIAELLASEHLFGAGLG